MNDAARAGRLPIIVVCALLSVACEPADPPVDVIDVGSGEADQFIGSIDGGLRDTGSFDFGWLDVGPLDVGPLDVGRGDPNVTDVGAPDRGTPADVGVGDAGMATPDGGAPDRCARWAGLTDQPLLDALHAELSSTYRPIEPLRFAKGQPDPDGEPLRYPTARLFMFTEIEWGPIPEGTGYECAYTGRTFSAGAGVELDDEVVNCEHTWPRDRFDDQPRPFYEHQQSDIHHLLPTDSGVNSARGNLRFGSVTDGPDTDLTYLPAVSGPDATGEMVFMPRRERRGDVARVMFYFATRWGAPMDPAEHEVLRRWAQRDPVDARERRRNDVIAGIQGNRNPFVDCPSLMDAIDAFPGFEPLDSEDDLPLP